VSDSRRAFQGPRLFFDYALRTTKGYPEITHPAFPFAPGQHFAYIQGMTLEAIKEAITDLAPDEKARLAAWLLQQDMEESWFGS
jgi:hypothetical protein